MASCSCITYGLYKFDITPLVSLQETYSRRGNELKFFKETTITLSGTLIYNLVVAPSGTDSRISRIREQQKSIETAFSTDRQNLLITDPSGYEIINAHPTVESINFEEGTWATKSDYTIVLKYEEETQSEFILSATDSWTSQKNNNETISVSHSVSAKGIRGDYIAGNSKNAFINAKDFVISKINIDPTTKQFFIGISGFSGYNHSKQESSNIEDANYSINESWTLHNNNYIDDRIISTVYNIEINGEQNIVKNINGTVTGLAIGDEPTASGKLLAAETAFDNIISSEIGFNANNIISKSKQTNLFAGTLSYSISINNNPSGTLINKSINRRFNRNNDGSTSQIVTVSAEISPRGSGIIQDAIDWVDINIKDIDSINPPYSTISGILITRGSSLNELKKTYSRTNTYIDVKNINYRENYNINSTIGQDGILRVNVNGNIIGLDDESTTNSEERFDKARNGYITVSGLAFSRADLIGKDLGRILINHIDSFTLGYNKKAGTVSYTHTYTDKTAPPSGIMSETISIQDSGGDPTIIITNIPGRSSGPVFDLINTISAYVRQINLNWRLEPNFTESQADAASLITISGFLPNYTTTNNIANFKSVQSKSFDPRSRNYSRNVTIEYTLSGATWRLTLPNDI